MALAKGVQYIYVAVVTSKARAAKIA